MGGIKAANSEADVKAELAKAKVRAAAVSEIAYLPRVAAASRPADAATYATNAA